MLDTIENLRHRRSLASESGKSVQTLRILVVDDDPMIGALLSTMLEALGHSVCAVASNEIDAVKQGIRHKPSLMIVDAWLGAGSGVAAVGQILQHGFIPHLFMSGNIAKVRQLRPDAVLLEKPFKELALIRAIRNALAIPSAT